MSHQSTLADGDVLPLPLSLDDLLQMAPAAVPWLWHGYLARGNVTLLTSLWKLGKTTLVSLLIKSMERGELLAGRTVATGKAIIVSDETRELWAMRHQQLRFGDNICLLSRPFPGRPDRERWLGLIDRIGKLHDAHDFSLAVIDPLVCFLPGHGVENCSSLMMEALMPLHRLTHSGLAVLLVHHPRKAVARAGMRSRGSGTLTGFADILMEMDGIPSAGRADRRRVIYAYSRFAETPASQVIELTEDGTGYRNLGEFAEAGYEAGLRHLQAVLAAEGGKLTRQEILARWPATQMPPGDATLCRWLRKAIEHGLICQEGTGHRKEPYRFSLRKQQDGD